MGTCAEVGGFYEGRLDLSDEVLTFEERILTVRNPSDSQDPFASETSSVEEQTATGRWSFEGGDEQSMIGRAA